MSSSSLAAVARIVNGPGGKSVSNVAAAAYALGYNAGLLSTRALTAASPPAVPLHQQEPVEGPIETFRKDYKTFPFACSHVDLDFNLGETTTVKAAFTLQRTDQGDLILDGPEDTAAMSLQVKALRNHITLALSKPDQAHGWLTPLPSHSTIAVFLKCASNPARLPVHPASREQRPTPIDPAPLK